MNFADIWARLLSKKPTLTDPKATVTMNSEQLRKLLRQVHDQGVIAGQKSVDTEASMDRIFGNFFS